MTIPFVFEDTVTIEGANSEFKFSVLGASDNMLFNVDTENGYAQAFGVFQIVATGSIGNGQLVWMNDNAIAARSIYSESADSLDTEANQIKFTQYDLVGGSPVAFSVEGGAHTGLANSSFVDVSIDMSRTISFTGGAGSPFDVTVFDIISPTISAASSQDFGIVSVMRMLYPSFAGSANPAAAVAGMLAPGGYQAFSDSAFNFLGLGLGIADGIVGSTTARADFAVLNSGFGQAPVELGAATGTLNFYSSVLIDAVEVQSTAGTWTISNFAGAIFNAPIAGNNVTATPFSVIANGDFRLDGNMLVGLDAAGSSADGVLALSNSATAPSDSADMAQLYSADLSAGNATLGIYTETAVAADASLVSTHSLTVFVNGSTYKIPLTSTP